MALADSLNSMRGVNLSDLTLDNIGTWPMPVKVVVWALVFVLVCYLGYNYHLKDLRTQLEGVRGTEVQLREEYRAKAFQVANLDAQFFKEIVGRGDRLLVWGSAGVEDVFRRFLAFVASELAAAPDPPAQD